MNSNTENPLKLRVHVTSVSQKKYVENASVGKENQENKMPGLDAARKVTSPPSFRGRKHSDNSFDLPLRPRGLQDVDTSNTQGVIPKRRNHSTGDTSGSKPFVKTKFAIYDDTQCQNNQVTRKAANVKSNVTEKTAKPLSLRDIAKDNVPAQKSRENEQKKVNKKLPSKTTESQKVSPKDLPIIPKVNVLNIKEEHKRAPTVKKAPRAVYDVLSLELAYNIDYMHEYVRFQMEINEKKKVSASFLMTGVTADQRRLIVKYLISATTYYKYPSFILFQAVKIFDSYIDTVQVRLNELQTVALGALWIALKKDLIIDEIPEAATIIELAGNAFQGNKEPLIEYEKKILMSLNFEISFADPFSMLALYTVMIEEVRELTSIQVQELYYCGSYLIDLSLLHEKMVDISAIHLAAISAEIALVLMMSSNEDLKNPQWSHWRNRVFLANPTIGKFRLPDAEMNQIRNQLLQKIMLSKEMKTDYYIVYKKYNTKRYGPVSKFMVSKASTLYVQRISDPNYAGRPVFF